MVIYGNHQAGCRWGMQKHQSESWKVIPMSLLLAKAVRTKNDIIALNFPVSPNHKIYQNLKWFTVPVALIQIQMCVKLVRLEFNDPVNSQITWSRLLIQIQILNGKQCRSRSVGFFRSQLVWIYSLQRQGISGFSRTRVDHTVPGQV